MTRNAARFRNIEHIQAFVSDRIVPEKDAFITRAAMREEYEIWAVHRSEGMYTMNLFVADLFHVLSKEFVCLQTQARDPERGYPVRGWKHIRFRRGPEDRGEPFTLPKACALDVPTLRKFAQQRLCRADGKVVYRADVKRVFDVWAAQRGLLLENSKLARKSTWAQYKVWAERRSLYVDSRSFYEQLHPILEDEFQAEVDSISKSGLGTFWKPLTFLPGNFYDLSYSAIILGRACSEQCVKEGE